MTTFPPQGGQEGSALTYHCSPGKYPYPVSYRTCAHGEWSPMRLATGRLTSTAICKGNVDEVFISTFTRKWSHVGVLYYPSLTQIGCVRLSSSWITVTSGPGTSGSTLGQLRASPARKASPCMAQHRETALSLGSGQEPPLSVTTMVRKNKQASH